MNKFILLILSLILVGCTTYPSNVHQENPIKELYFAQKEISVRTFPSSDSPIVVKAYMKLGDRSPVYEERNGFYRVTLINAQNLWIKKDSLCDRYACWLENSSDKKFSYVANKSTSSTVYSSKRKVSRKTTSKQRIYESGPCPCNGSNICIGPRGGRYCMTSGGNKRYL